MDANGLGSLSGDSLSLATGQQRWQQCYLLTYPLRGGEVRMVVGVVVGVLQRVTFPEYIPPH